VSGLVDVSVAAEKSLLSERVDMARRSMGEGLEVCECASQLTKRAATSEKAVSSWKEDNDQLLGELRDVALPSVEGMADVVVSAACDQMLMDLDCNEDDGSLPVQGDRPHAGIRCSARRPVCRWPEGWDQQAPR
jgi:hypothetical protein